MDINEIRKRATEIKKQRDNVQKLEEELVAFLNIPNMTNEELLRVGTLLLFCEYTFSKVEEELTRRKLIK